jgi:uncharacterized protein (DUF1800 family)
LAALVLASAIAPAAAETAPTRPQIQHLLRRFSFSAAPETVTATLAQGISAWLAQQENWSALDDSNSELETLPTALNSSGGYDDYSIFERAVMQHMVLTPRQLQAKLELHWLDHFAVGLEKVGDPAMMYHYDQTIRANALGNFTTLMTAVALEPAMLIWLDNNNNSGPVANENFARELMQLYTTGTTRLNPDGSPIVMNGAPLPNYGEVDVQEVAKAITGYSVYVDYTNNNPQTRFSVQWVPNNHYTGKIAFLGRVRDIPNDATALPYVISIIATQPSVAPFMARELLQRFVTETPSAGYISRIAAVWTAQQKAPDQIAQVINAIVNDAEFATAYRSMPKQPAEMVIDALRIMPGMLQSAANASPGGSLLWELSNLNQELFYPATVFSFYRPGNLSSLTNTGSVLSRTSVFANITNASPSGSYTDTYIDIATLRTRINNTKGWAVRNYLLDAFLDGGTTVQQDLLGGYLGATPSDNQILGAIWIVLNTPDYSVN